MRAPGLGWQILAMLVGACLTASTSCKGRSRSQTAVAQNAPSLGPVTVKPIPAVDFRGARLTLDEGQVAAKAKTVLERAAIFAPAASAPGTVAVSVELAPFTEGSADALEIGVKLRIRMSLRPEGSAPGRFADDAAAVGQAPLDTRDVGAATAALQRLAERTLEDLLQGYVDRQKLWTGDVATLARALSSPDVDSRTEALRVVGARHMRELSPTVIRLLTDEDEGVRDAALGAVMALGDRAAVKALASSRQMRDTREMRKVIDAIAALGGREAREYLAFVAETHDDEEIRSLAKAALARMEKTPEGHQPTR